VKKDTVYSVKEVELIETKLKLLTDALLKLSLMIKKDDKVLLNKVATRLDLGNQEDNIYLQVNEALSEFDNMGCYNSCRSNDIMTPSCSSSSIHSDPNTHYEKTLAHQLDSTLTSKSEKEKEPVLPVSLDRSIMLSKRNMALNDELCAFGTLKRINSQNTVAESEETRAEKKNWKEMLFFLPKLILHFVWGVFVFS